MTGPDPSTVQVKDPAGAITTVVDLLGRTVSYTDALGTLTTTVYDPAGRVRETMSARPGSRPAPRSSPTMRRAGWTR